LNYRSDTSNQLSHNKFCVIDDRMVWTGSFNPTYNGDQKNNNNVIVIFSQYIASNYAREFEELWRGVYGSGQQTQYGSVRLNGHIYENYFCPDDDCRQQVLQELEQAQHSIYFMTFSFTDRAIADALIAKSDQGLTVKGVMEKQRVNMQYNLYSYLAGHGVDVVADSNPRFMHHKLFIIDNSTVITGSWNPTKSGSERNDENIIVIHHNGIARKYLDEFSRISIT
jgi:phosphatidylserine/phosphatidylglycerophosphate/cardiolipin synthase-like enzyme